MKEESPLKQIAAEAAKISKNKEIVLHNPKSLKNILKETSLQDVFPKKNNSVFTDCYTKILTIFSKQFF
ncbi:hypothetical protein Gotur_028887 [Gossypium turneri]